MHDFKPGDLVRRAWTGERGVVVEHNTRNEVWKQVFVSVHWFERGATTQARALAIRRLEEE
tara:strand:+ start:931 stop:1113 length:183 start_codon:yes stop_codon:yes gene_type:complete